MCKLIIPFLAIVLLTIATQAHAVSIVLDWTYPAGSNPAASWVYRKDNCNNGQMVKGEGIRLNALGIAPAINSFEDKDVPAGTFCYAVTATNSIGSEGALSNIVQFQVPTAPPTALNVRGTIKP